MEDSRGRKTDSEQVQGSNFCHANSYRSHWLHLEVDLDKIIDPVFKNSLLIGTFNTSNNRVHSVFCRFFLIKKYKL